MRDVFSSPKATIANTFFEMQVKLNFNPLNTKRRLLYLKTQFVQRVNTFHIGYKNQSVYAVSGTSRCLFSDKNTKHINTVWAERAVVEC